MQKLNYNYVTVQPYVFEDGRDFMDHYSSTLAVAANRDLKERSEFARRFQAVPMRPLSSGSWERPACGS